MSRQEQCKLTINGSREISVRKGQVLLSELWRHNVLVPSVCGGRGMCGVCKVRIIRGAEHLEITPAEQKRLHAEELNKQIRLACQIRINADLAIEIPEEYTTVRRWQTRCTAIEDLTYDTRRFRFELAPPSRMNFTAGHYVQLVCPAYTEGVEMTTRAFSIASGPSDNRHIELIIRRVPGGICTSWLFEYLKIDDTVEMTGPYGEFHLSDTDAPMVFIAGGSGMAPFVSILNSMKSSGSVRKADYFFGGNSIHDLCLGDEMAGFEKALPNFKFHPVVCRPQPEDNWQGQTGLVTEAVKRSYTDLSRHEGYLCGSPGMIDASIRVLRELGMPQEKIYFDKFA